MDHPELPSATSDAAVLARRATGTYPNGQARLDAACAKADGAL